MQVFTQSLAQSWPTLTPDLRGYGQSQVRRPFPMSQHLLDLDQLLRDRQIDECVVLGWSLGGILSLELALAQPQRVKGMILIASAADPRSSHPPITWQDNVLTAIASLLNRWKPGWPWNIRQFGQRSLYRYLVQTHRPQTYRYLARDAWPAFFRTSKFAHRSLQEALRQGYNREAQLASIPCPVLVLAGEGDRHITARSSYRTACELPRSTWICYPHCAHLFPWEYPEEINAAIHQWLSQHFDSF